MPPTDPTPGRRVIHAGIAAAMVAAAVLIRQDARLLPRVTVYPVGTLTAVQVDCCGCAAVVGVDPAQRTLQVWGRHGDAGLPVAMTVGVEETWVQVWTGDKIRIVSIINRRE
jgi:predicted amino acid dehydrogenase